MKIQPTFSRSLREAGALALMGIVLGLVYNALSSRGIDFIRKEQELGWSSDVSHTSRHNLTSNPAQPLFITVDEAFKIFEEGTALFIDSRPEKEFQAGRIKGAISLPLKKLEENPALLQDIPKDKLIVTYCSGVECDASIYLGQKLASMGFANVRVFFAGWNDWVQRGLPTESGPKESL